MPTFLRALPSLAVVFLLLASGCDTGGDESGPSGPLSPSANLNPDVAPVTQGSWYRPATDVTWQWQLQGALNTSYDADLYDVDLFDTPPATIAALHQAGRKVLCYFSAGSGEEWRDDFDQFDSAVLGRPLDGWEGERWLDIRAQNVIDVMEARLDLAAQRGCDGVEPDNVAAYDDATGFDFSARDQLAFNRHLANEAHRRGLAIALKNAGDQADALAPYFDLELNEECHAYDECGQLSPFGEQGKPILNAEYADTEAQAQRMRADVCAAARTHGTRTLLLPLDLDDGFRVACP